MHKMGFVKTGVIGTVSNKLSNNLINRIEYLGSLSPNFGKNLLNFFDLSKQNFYNSRFSALYQLHSILSCYLWYNRFESIPYAILLTSNYWPLFYKFARKLGPNNRLMNKLFSCGSKKISFIFFYQYIIFKAESAI